MYVSRRKIYLISILMITELIVFLSIQSECSYSSIAIISIIQLIINIGFVSIETNRGVFSFASMFLFFSWFFHCGQIIKLGFNIPGLVPLDVTRYADAYEIVQAFRFYYLTQFMVTCGMLLCPSKSKRKIIRDGTDISFNAKKTYMWLWAIGIVPRIYIDSLILRNGFSNGYAGVYNLVIPQMFQTLAFFFDAGCIVALMNKRENKRHAILFWVVLVYKCITMSTGARQERIAFLIIWIMIYYFIVNDIKIRNIITLSAIVFFGVMLIHAIGNVRTSGDLSFTAIIDNLSLTSENSILGDMLGEFGSALTTLATTMRNIPSKVGFGYGDAYLAGALSIIPTLATRVGLGSAAVYVSKLPGATYFGGSYIGELYYNFSWLGIIGGLIIGRVIMSAQLNIYECKNKVLSLKKVYSAIVMISMYLFVRGYFADMAQRLVWIWILLNIINNKKIKFRNR